MSLSAKQAAEQVGLSKQGIIKAIKQGKLSAAKDDNGEWQIDPAELFRVYQPAVHGSPPPPSQQTANHHPRLTAVYSNPSENFSDPPVVFIRTQ